MKEILLSVLLACGLIAVNAQETNLGWLGRVAGSGFDQVWDLHIDDSDHTFIAGSFTGTTQFIGDNETLTVASNGDQDAYMVKFNADGSVAWYVTFGGVDEDYCYGVTTDSDDNVFIAGAFKGTVDFDPNGSGNVKTAVDNFDMYISKYNKEGEYLWTKVIGSGSVDEAKSITTDVNDDVYVTGRFLKRTDFDPGSGVAELNGANSTPDAFVLKLDNDGNYEWAHRLGSSSGNELGEDILDGRDGSIVVSGGFTGTVDFDPGSGVSELFGGGLLEIFFVKIDYNGDFRWVKSFEGDGYETCQDIAIDHDGNIYATGFFRDEVDFDTGSGVTLFTAEAAEDSFIAKLNPQGNTVWAKQIGSPNAEWSFGIAVDELGDVYTTGFFGGTVDFDPGSGVHQVSSTGLEDVFITKFTTDGIFKWAKQLGGTGSDAGYGIEVGDNGDVFVLGNHWDMADLDPESSVLNVGTNGSSDAFLIKINQEVISFINDYHTPRSSYSIFPNPSIGDLTIQRLESADAFYIEVFNINGNRVGQYSILSNHSLDLSRLNPGMYTVVIYDKSGRVNIPWVKI